MSMGFQKYILFKSQQHKYSQLSIICSNRGRGLDNLKPWLKQEQSQHGTKWI
jgi:hypothetical protein